MYIYKITWPVVSTGMKCAVIMKEEHTMQDLETKQPGVQLAYHEVHGEFKK
jgi:hypothetical protein